MQLTEYIVTGRDQNEIDPNVFHGAHSSFIHRSRLFYMMQRALAASYILYINVLYNRDRLWGTSEQFFWIWTANIAL